MYHYLFHLGAIQHIEEANGFRYNPSFLLNNKIYKIKNPDPNKTILSYVRDDLKKLELKKVVQKEAVEHAQ